MGGLLDDAAGESGPCGAALPQSRVGSCDTYPVQDTGNRGGTSCAALPCTSFGPCQAARVFNAALPLGQVGKSHGGVNLPPVLITSTMLTSALLLLPANKRKKTLIQSRNGAFAFSYGAKIIWVNEEVAVQIQEQLPRGIM